MAPRKITVRRNKKGRITKLVKAPKGMKLVKRAVRNVLDQQLEHKHKSWLIGENLLAGPDISGANILPLVGPVSQGTGGNQRVGMRVKPLSIVVKGNVHYDSAVGGCESVRPVLYFLNSRQIKTNLGITANHFGIASQLLDDWDGSNALFDGTMENAQYPVNADDYTVIKVLRPVITKDNQTSSDGKSYYEFSVNLKAPKVLHYDEGSTYPSNFAPFVAVGWYKADGGAPDAETWVQVTARTFMSYIDA